MRSSRYQSNHRSRPSWTVRSARIETLESRDLLAVTIYAAGEMNTEQMQLQVDGLPIATWDNVGGNAANGIFVAYSATTPIGLTPDRVRVAFLNDLWDPSNGIDRNLRIDKIEIDGVPYQSEAATVYSTGTWKPDDGLVYGFRNSEYLNAGGYFQYGVPGPGTRSVVNILAQGTEGDERMELRIDGLRVAAWDNIGRTLQTFTYSTTSLLTPDGIQVAFTNDLWDPANGIDRTLRVDRIELNGVPFETEAPTVYSTGTWKPEDGVTPGFRQSEYLDAGGYFQYGVVGSGTGTVVTIRALGEMGDEQMQLQIDGLAVALWENIGTTWQTYSFAANSVVTADRVRVLFTNDLWDPQNGIDRNLRVDWIQLDGITYQTEDPSVFASASWKPEDGIVGGYRESEYLHANGYFQYGTITRQVPSLVALQSSQINVVESEPFVSVTVVRTGGLDQPLTVDYRAYSRTALVGSDFAPVVGTLSFAPQVDRQNITIPIFDDLAQEGRETLAVTIDNAQGNASLGAPRTAIVTIVDDDLELPTYATFSDVARLHLQGAATVAGNALRLTDNSSLAVGGAFFESPVPVDVDRSFQSQFQFRMTPQGSNGGSGFAFVLQNSPAGITALGQPADQLGYGGITSSLAIEFDTEMSPWDTNNNHVSFLRDGDVTRPIATTSVPFRLNLGASVYAWVQYHGESDSLSLYLSETDEIPAQPVLTASVDLAAIVGAQAYVGFTAATGILPQTHEIVSWQFTDAPPINNVNSGVASLINETIADGINQPIAIDWSDAGRNLLIALQSGIVQIMRDGQMLPTPFIDISAEVNSVRDRGLTDIAVHPDFLNHPYVYLLYTYDPPETAQFTGLAGPDGAGNRAGRLTRVTADPATNYTTAIPGSEIVLLGRNSVWGNFNPFVNSTFDFNEPPAGILPDGTNLQDFIAADSESHTVDCIEFAPDGSLFVSIGDGASYNQQDVRIVRVQDIDNLSGKVLRIDPLTGNGLPDNPFYDNNPQSNRSKVYHYGLRNPFRIAVDSANGNVFLGDVGWTQWEEINFAAPGANFGWPYYEGGNGVSLKSIAYQDLPEAQPFYLNTTVTPAIFALNHAADGINAIIAGAVYRGTAYPSQYFGDLFFNDLGQGIVRNISLDANGVVTGVEVFATDAIFVVQIKQGPDGLLYYAGLNGSIGRWVFG